VLPVPEFVSLIVYWGCLLLGAVAFIDALRQRRDAFPAVDRQTKPIWLGILGGGILAQWFFPALGGGLLSLLGLAGIVAAIVYLVDVRRRVVEITRGPRW
jgi:hypothetical protein